LNTIFGSSTFSYQASSAIVTYSAGQWGGTRERRKRAAANLERPELHPRVGDGAQMYWMKNGNIALAQVEVEEKPPIRKKCCCY
jgi:hypothetical protein